MRRLERFYRLGYTFEGNLGRHIYAPLRSPDSIRLINVQPGDPGSGVECELLTTRLQGAPMYQALSYCWGDPTRTQLIKCNGQDFAVTTNLYDALSRLRESHEQRTMWIDAICINQRDYAERNRQLLLMRHIYQKAKQVAVWIGKEADTIGAVQFMLRTLREIGKRANGIVHLEPTAANLESLGLPEQTSPAWSALRYFFRRPWFERVWVIQEAVNASDLQVMCGQQSFEWEDIAYAARCIADSPMFATTDTARICQHIRFIDQCRQKFRQSRSDQEQPALLDLLYGSRRCDASDQRDKIYGLYPLIESLSKLPSPDYTKPVDTIYRETAAHIIGRTGKLDVLRFAGAARHPRTRSLNLPSWVPDWHSHDRATSLAEIFRSQTRRAEVSFSSSLDAITVKGTVLDEVASLSDTIQPFQGSINGERVDWAFLDWPNGRVRLEPTGEEVNIIDVVLHSLLSHSLDRDSRLLPMSLIKGGARTTRNNAMKLLYGRRVFRSSSGRLGLISSYATTRDRIALFSGAGVPFVIRSTGSSSYNLIGECFLAGFMGEMHLTCAEEEREITLK
ncbi:heterokaryon incompatibility protein-domain-containing protein [Fusarium sp. MPI-SDFR-AT-0072]|nr:heterokaryon incompatibility protein-domain-containing protein [Fusarium sp. MPI-SDFR-AT-0072]